MKPNRRAHNDCVDTHGTGCQLMNMRFVQALDLQPGDACGFVSVTRQMLIHFVEAQFPVKKDPPPEGAGETRPSPAGCAVAGRQDASWELADYGCTATRHPRQIAGAPGSTAGRPRCIGRGTEEVSIEVVCARGILLPTLVQTRCLRRTRTGRSCSAARYATSSSSASTMRSSCRPTSWTTS